MAFDAQRGQMALWGGRDANGFFSDSWQLASPCSRTMSVVTAPQLLMPAVFRYSYPPSAAGHFGVHLLTLHQAGGFQVPIPGFSSFGECFVDLFSIRVQTFTLLDASGVSDLAVQMPGDPYLVGLPFDVQAVDISFQASAVYWAESDVEVAIAPVTPPVASFTASLTSGVAPLAVQFTDTSTNGPTSWQWDFDNDGTVDSTQQNPSYIYTTAGIYSVRLVASNLGGASASLRSHLIYAGPLVPNPLLNMVRVAAGTFQMGSTFVGGTAAPVHSVTITRPFWVGKYEVTQAEYQAVIGSNPSRYQGESYPNAPQRPVEQVSWNSARAYCSALTATEAAAGRIPAGYQYRLPTEAEWEYVCRAGTTTLWNTEASLACAQANFSGCGPGQTTVVGGYPANPWGLFDTHGNVLEWCLDSWDGSANYPASAVSDPYVSSGPYRVFRGGSWNSISSSCRSAFRNAYSPGDTYAVIGFRVVLAPILVP
ncbi:MAG: SUMF1/EgtB/PvdO family nonheme iron enzyme [Planctomycetota bacterium]